MSSGRWFEFNDATVSQLPEGGLEKAYGEDAKSGSAYLLMYRRCEAAATKAEHEDDAGDVPRVERRVCHCCYIVRVARLCVGEQALRELVAGEDAEWLEAHERAVAAARVRTMSVVYEGERCALVLDQGEHCVPSVCEGG